MEYLQENRLLALGVDQECVNVFVVLGQVEVEDERVELLYGEVKTSGEVPALFEKVDGDEAVESVGREEDEEEIVYDGDDFQCRCREQRFKLILGEEDVERSSEEGIEEMRVLEKVALELVLIHFLYAFVRCVCVRVCVCVCV